MSTAISEASLPPATAPRSDSTRRRANSPAWLIATRLVAGVVILFFISIIVFAATQAIPSDPARSILGPGATPDQVAALREQLGLDLPLITQFTNWLGGAVTGNFGNSLVSGQPVSRVIGDAIVNTGTLVLVVTVLAIILSIGFGLLAALRRDSPGDHTFVVSSILLSGIPSFVVGIVLVMLFSTSVFHILPAVSLLRAGETPLSDPKTLILPVAALLCASVPYLARLIRASMIDALDSEYVVMARMKGVPEWRILLRHALPNAVVPMIQGTALTMSWLAGGTVAVEFLFNYPGLGSALSQAVTQSDVPVVQASVLVLAGAVVVFNLLADVLTVFLTPRLRVG